MTNDLDAILVLVLGTVAAFGALLFLLAYLEPTQGDLTEQLMHDHEVQLPRQADDSAVAHSYAV